MTTGDSVTRPEYGTGGDRATRAARCAGGFFPVFGNPSYRRDVAKRPMAASQGAEALIERVHQELGAQLRKIRTTKQLRRRDVTRTARVGSDRVGNIEDNLKGPDGWSLGPLCRIADALGYDLEVRFVRREDTTV